MSTTPTIDTAVLPEGYRVLDFEVAGFARQDQVNAAVTSVLDRAASTAPVMLPAAVGLCAAYVASHAAEQVARYPQYSGRFDSGWTLVRFTRTVVTKGGCRFAAGDVTLARVETSPFPLLEAARWTAWSIRGAVECSVPPGSWEAV